ncbi:MAG: hypothetical protein DRJ47_07860 [Thermoprotei archaeon]|nr:MAG: hypothetical protein DRJ47_07860 [Thermoprotei archaeon]
MRVLLVVPSLDVAKFKGLAKTSLELVKGLEKTVDLEVYEVHNISKNSGYFKNVTTVPLKQLTSKVDICHAMVPESGAIAFLKRNLVVTFHDFVPLRLPERLNFKNTLLLKAYVNLTWRLASRAKTILCNSTQTAAEVKSFFKRDSIVVNPGVDERFKPMHIKKEKPTLGFFANFTYRKRADIAVKVFKILKQKIDCKLILAGGYIQSLYQRNFDIKRMVEDLKDVEVYGYIPEEDLVRLYNSFDFYLFPSVFEGFGIPILEAQKCGIPTFIMRDAMIPQETKRMAIECSSPEDMAGKILYLLENKDEYRRISEQGRRYASQFTWKKFVEQHLTIYESLVKR